MGLYGQGMIYIEMAHHLLLINHEKITCMEWTGITFTALAGQSYRFFQFLWSNVKLNKLIDRLSYKISYNFLHWSRSRQYIFSLLPHL